MGVQLLAANESSGLSLPQSKRKWQNYAFLRVFNCTAFPAEAPAVIVVKHHLFSYACNFEVIRQLPFPQ